MNKLVKGLALALFASVAYALWSILSDVVVSLNRVNYFDYLIIFEASLTVLSLALVFVFKGYRKEGKRKSNKRLFTYSLLAGMFFGLGTIIFFALIGNQNYPFVASASYISVIPFVFFIAKAKKQDPKLLAILGTIAVFAGLVFQIIGLYGYDFYAAAPIILLTALMTVFWTAGYYILLISMVFKGYNILKSDVLMGVFEFLTVGVYGLLTGAFREIFSLTSLEVLLSILVAGFLLLGGLSEEFSFRLLIRFKEKYLDLWNVLVSLEIVGIAIFSIFFLTLYYPLLIAGLALIIAGVILIIIS